MGRLGGGGVSLSTGKCSFPRSVHMTFPGSCLALHLKVLGLENTFCGLRPAFPGASITFPHMHAHRYLPPPLWASPWP